MSVCLSKIIKPSLSATLTSPGTFTQINFLSFLQSAVRGGGRGEAPTSVITHSDTSTLPTSVQTVSSDTDPRFIT